MIVSCNSPQSKLTCMSIAEFHRAIQAVNNQIQTFTWIGICVHQYTILLFVNLSHKAALNFLSIYLFLHITMLLFQICCNVHFIPRVLIKYEGFDSLQASYFFFLFRANKTLDLCIFSITRCLSSVFLFCFLFHWTVWIHTIHDK